MPTSKIEENTAPPPPRDILTSKEIELATPRSQESYNSNLLDIARSHWQYGDWGSLAELNINHLQNHPDRAKLALLAAAGHQQLGDLHQAKILSHLSLDWGCNKKLVSKILIAGVHNTLGRAAVATGHVPLLLKHFEASIIHGTPGISGGTLRSHVRQRIGQEFVQMGLPLPELLHRASLKGDIDGANTARSQLKNIKPRIEKPQTVELGTRLELGPFCHLKSKKILKTNTNNQKIHIITTLDEVGVEEYLEMLRSLRENLGQIENLNVVTLYGSISLSSQRVLKNVVDDMQCFSEFKSYKYLSDLYGKKLFHPLGKLGKLFFMREYLERYANAKDVSIFVDPDVIIQQPLQNFLSLVMENKVLFGYEIQLAHRDHLPNVRLMKAELFDKHGPWQATYFTEINTGINLSYAQSFCDLMFDFEKFVFSSEYFHKIDEIPDGNKWHDQDFFRYFYRKFIRLDIGVFDVEQVFTTTKGGAKCIRFDISKNKYITTWGKIPCLVHFAGGTLGQVPHINPLKKEMIR